MSKVLVDFDAVGFRKKLNEYKESAEKLCIKQNDVKISKDDKIAYLNKQMSIASCTSLSLAFDIVLELMEQYTTYEDAKQIQN